MVEPDPVLLAAANARTDGLLCALATVVQAVGSCPREAGARMLVRADGSILGTVGGGKFEALVIAEALACLREQTTRLREFPLHEAAPDSFGAICGGTVTVFLEPIGTRERIFIVGGGHVGEALTRLARLSGLFAVLHDDRSDAGSAGSPEAFLGAIAWRNGDALVLVNRNPELDRRSLAAALSLAHPPSYLGMIGSTRKVRRVFEELSAAGVTPAQLANVRAPIGLDLGAESPSEIAVSILAEILSVLRRRPATPLRDSLRD